MKIIVIAMILSLGFVSYCSGTETLLENDLDGGGFGGPVFKYSSVAGEVSSFVGGRGGWIISRNFTLGGGGYGLAGRREPAGGSLQMGYGGFIVEYISKPETLYHLTVALLVGGGGVGHSEADRDYLTSAFLVIEPEAGVELNISSNFRIAATVGYRSVGATILRDGEEKGLSALTAALTLKFGSF